MALSENYEIAYFRSVKNLLQHPLKEWKIPCIFGDSSLLVVVIASTINPSTYKTFPGVGLAYGTTRAQGLALLAYPAQSTKGVG